ncbi:hypothetical protein [Streptomyces sp. NRRL F-5135]|uniref:hypothetical protein n=1 Tax=Streptomyces sp. NRRL F-5135 TaxID=1463858 RepID=UPI0004C4CE49|nr:hypothetical protein [Streptomyces sp. NRRL F-5135]
MARIQILDLPMEHHGEETTSPFLIIVDGLAPDSELLSGDRAERTAEMCRVWGARGLLTTTDTLDVT